MSTETTEQETTETGLSIVPKITAVTFFSAGGSTSVLETLKKGIRAEAAKLDISTVKGRQAIISLAASVATTKNKLEKAGKALVADEKERLKLVDKERGIVWDEMEALQKEVRQPVTDWEQADAKRIAGLEYKVITMSELGTLAYGASTEDIEARLESVNALADSMTDMMEFTSRAELVTKQTREALNAALAQSKARDAQAAEMARLQAEELARKQRENEERIRLEAKQDAERRAEVERQRIEQERNEADARAKQEEARRVAAEAQAARDAEAAEARRVEEARLAEERHAESLRQAELLRIANEVKAEKEAEERARHHAAELKAAEEKRVREAKEAEERAEVASKAAIEAERVRVADEARKAQEEATKRENNRKHAAKVNGEVLAALMQHGMISEDQGRAIVTALAKGLVPHTKISY